MLFDSAFSPKLVSLLAEPSSQLFDCFSLETIASRSVIVKGKGTFSTEKSLLSVDFVHKVDLNEV
jgi:hypothetical protein